MNYVKKLKKCQNIQSLESEQGLTNNLIKANNLKRNIINLHST